MMILTCDLNGLKKSVTSAPTS